MSLFDDLEENLRKTYNTSVKESFDDIGFDQEEKDKIINQVSGSNASHLNVDYSDFSNHIFFGSAYAASNFALARVIRDYPTDGELKEKNKWHDTNTGYENWFFDNFPKQQGYITAQSGLGWASVSDFEGKLSLNSGSILSSFTIELVSSITPDFNGAQSLIAARNNDGSKAVYLKLNNGNQGKNLSLNFIDANLSSLSEITASIDLYVSQSNSYAATYDNVSKQAKLYINGDLVSQKTISGPSTGSINANYVDVGYYDAIVSGSGKIYSIASIDDVRIWNQSRSEDLIKRNYYRTIHANHSGGLKLYWKFNEPSEYGTTIVDYSGNELHGQLTGTLTPSQSSLLMRVSGTLGSWFKDEGSPILALQNTRTNAFIAEQRNSGSLYDDNNQNMIFNLVPGVFVDGDDTEYQQLFLLLTARHFDRLKLYIQHLSNLTKQQTSQYNGPPSNLLDLTAKHYGFDIGGIYSSADPLQNFFGENVYSSGALDTSIEQIKTTLKRNVVSNLTHILKSKGTQEALKSTLRAVGLNDSIVSINEYTDFSGGVQTTFSPKTVERRVAKFLTSSNVFITSSVDFSNNAGEYYVYQNRFLLNTSSLYLTQTLMSFVDTNGSYLAEIRAERSNLTSSEGKIRFVGSGGDVTSSTSQIWNGNWNNLTWQYWSGGERLYYYISSTDRAGIIFEQSASLQSFTINLPSDKSRIVLGTSGSNCFDGYIHEFRAWSHNNNWTERLPIYKRWAYDWELTEVVDPINGYNDLICYLKLDDFTGSISGGGPIHDYRNGFSGSSYTGFSSSAQSNFPGKYIDKFDVSHTYDLNVDNDKIRIRDGSDFSKDDQNYDIPYISIDFSPITALNKEIMKWMGNLERIVQITNDPIYQYRDTNSHLDALRSAFFRERVNSRIDFAAFANLIKWFDNNFGFLLSQLIPLDMGYSISNYVIEPHILEYNKVKKFVGAKAAGRTSNLEASVNRIPQITVRGDGNNLGLADPGRYGSFVSSSAEVSKDIYLVYSSSSNGINHENYIGRRIMDAVHEEDREKNTPDGYGNGFYVQTITGSNYLKNTLNVNPHFAISGVYFSGAGNLNTNFLSSSHGRPDSPWTGSFNGYQDARWLWMGPVSGGFPTFDVNAYTTQYAVNYGIGYGGMWGQLHARSNRSFVGTPLRPGGQSPPGASSTSARYVGGIEYNPGAAEVATRFPKISFEYIKYFNEDDLRTFIFWPTANDFDGVEITAIQGSFAFKDGSIARGLGDTIKIEEYDTLNIEILGKTNPKITGDDFILSVQMKFQFFSDETPGDFGYETVLSASRSGVYEQTNVPIEYNLRTQTLPAEKPVSFQLSLERSLPRQRYMRVFVYPYMETVSFGGVKMLFKAVLSNKQKLSDDLSIRDV